MRALLLVLSTLSPTAWGQDDCAARAERTAAAASIAASRGQRAEAERLLRQAENQCPSSGRVLRRIAEVFGQMGNQREATYFVDAAARLGGKSASGAQPPVAVSKNVRKKWALVVGINRFRNPAIPPLAFPAKDARDFAKFLTGPLGNFGSNDVQVLLDDKANTTSIRSALGQIAANDHPDDLVVLYFSSHGTSPDMDRSNNQAAFLVTHDTNPEDLYATSLGMDELARFMETKLHAQRVAMFLDTCHSGDTARFLRQSAAGKSLSAGAASSPAVSTTDTLTRVTRSTGRVVITSSSSQELSWESNDLRNGFFTSALLAAFERRRGAASMYELFAEISASMPKAVKDYTKKHKIVGGEGAVQTPQMFPTAGVPEFSITAVPSAQ